MDAALSGYAASIHSRRDEMARFLADLIRHPTENPPGAGYGNALQAVASHLETLGFDARVDPVPGGDEDPEHPRLWLRSSLGENGPTVVFHGHIDVVPAQAPSQFEPVVSDGAIVGRGSTDMKGGIVSMIYAMKLLQETGEPRHGRVELRIVPDEETGGRLGSGALSKEDLLVGPDDVAMLTAEPSGGLVWHASRGAITCRIDVKGRSSHVGLSYRGTNAFEKAVLVVRSLQELGLEVRNHRTRYPIEPEEARRSILLLGGEVRGCANFNVVPDRFSFSADRRINPEEDFDTENARLLAAIDAARKEGVDVAVDVLQEARPAGTPSEDPTARALAGAIEIARGEPARFELCPGILEIRFYAERGVPAFAYGPGLLSVAHGPKEFVKRRDLEQCAAVYALAARRILHPGSCGAPSATVQ